MDPPDSNERLCTIFEMMISRLDSLGAEFDKQKRITQHNDSLRPLGEAFSGINLCGVEIGLRVYTDFDADGVFADNCMCVFIGTKNVFNESLSAEEDGGKEWLTMCEPAIRASWDQYKYDDVILDLSEWTGAYKDTRRNAVKDEVFRAYLKHKHPTLLAWGPEGILTHCLDIKEAHRLVSEIARDIGTRTGNLEIHGIHRWQGKLAGSCVDKDKERIHAEWFRQNVDTRNLIQKANPFFTLDRLMIDN